VDPKQSELIGLVRALVDSLEAAQLSYAVGGAIALAAWSEPRATKDVDITAFVSDARVGDALFDALVTAGLTVDRELATRDARHRGMFVLRSDDGYRVDVFISSIPFYDVAEARRQRVQLAGRDAWVLDPESLAVFKMLFFRAKDLLDLQRLLEVRELDTGFVRTALVDVVGEDDERIARWDEMVGVSD